MYNKIIINNINKESNMNKIILSFVAVVVAGTALAGGWGRRVEVKPSTNPSAAPSSTTSANTSARSV